MGSASRVLLTCLATCLLVLAPRTVTAQTFDTFEVVFGFHPYGGSPLGRLLQTPDGALYGTSSTGGAYAGGSTFVLRPDGGGGFDYVELHAFSGPDGRAPLGGLTLGADGYFYGTTDYGGVNDAGTVYRTDSSGRITVIHSFPGFDVPEPRYPAGGLLAASDGFLYGAATGGLYGVGAIFRVSPAGEVSTVHDFDASDGSAPNGDLVESSDGYFYGTTLDGPGTESTIFRFNGAGDFASLHTLSSDEGNWIRGGLVESGGEFYGTSSLGGAHSAGTVFKVARDGSFTKLHDFGAGGDDGGAPYPGLTLASDGNLYGVSYGGGTNGDGALFRVDGSSGAVATIHSFDFFTDGSQPQGPLMQAASDGMLYGTTYAGGGPRTAGTVFGSSLGGAVTSLFFFRGTWGINPEGGLLAASDGNLYGTTLIGGASGGGTIFRLGGSDVPEFIASFGSPGIEGDHPVATLSESPSGTLLGTAQWGGPGLDGTVFQSDLAGSATGLATFSGPQGSRPSASPLRTADGNVWGTAIEGGISNDGVIYRIDSSGLADVHDFDEVDGGAPSSLVAGSDGSLYGIGAGGGYLGISGTAFKIDPSTATFTLLYAFGNVSGDPLVPSFLAAGAGGALYGTSLNGGVHGDGTVFQLGGTGVVTVLHSFQDGVDGFGPGTIMQAPTGDLYGTMAGTYGEVFRLDGGGNVTSVHSFTGGPDGANPTSPLVEATDGNLYGTASQGGVGLSGVVYRLLGSPSSPTLTSIVPTSGSAAGGASVRAVGTHFQPGPSLSFGAVASPAVLGIDSRTLVALASPLPAGSLNDVVVTNVDAGTVTLPDAWFADFLDVNSIDIFHDSVEAIVRAGITAGCGGGYYCAGASVTRAQMAVFLLKAEHGSAYVPPVCTGLFHDVACPGGFAADWIEELAAEGITGGCGGGNYCPASPVTRAQMAVLLLKTSLGTSYVPPVVAQIFGDVPPGAFAADWINDLYGRGITGGCQASPLLYCPNNPVLRQQMATFLVRTFAL